VSPEDPEAAPAGDGVIGAITKRAANTPLGSLAQAFEEGRHETQEQRMMRKEGIPIPSKSSSSSSTPAAAASPFKALTDRLRSALGERKQAAADKLESAQQQEAEEPQAQPKAQTKRDTEDEEDYKPSKREHKESRHSKDDDYYSKRERKHHSSHHDVNEEESEYYQDKKASKAQLKQEQQKQEVTKAEEPQTEAQPEQQQQQQQQEQPAVKAPVFEAPKNVGKNGDSSLASKLIPGLPVEATVPTPAGPPSLADMAKKIGATLGRAAPRNPLPSTYIDPQALADAGLPPVKNVGELMKSLMKSQIGKPLTYP
jgi:hypothetical protein